VQVEVAETRGLDRDHDLAEPGPWRGHILDLCRLSYSHEANGFQVVWPFFNISL